jgi:hypothetical protein
MNSMDMPGFTAEASLYKTSWHYATMQGPEGAAGAIRLAQFEDNGEPPSGDPCSLCLRTCRQNCRGHRNKARCFARCVQDSCEPLCPMM